MAFMISRLRSLFRRKPPAPAPAPPPKAWVYDSHEYRGVIEGNHVYAVRFVRDDEHLIRPFLFHAHTRTPKEDDRVEAYFRQQAPR